MAHELVQDPNNRSMFLLRDVEGNALRIKDELFARSLGDELVPLLVQLLELALEFYAGAPLWLQCLLGLVELTPDLGCPRFDNGESRLRLVAR